jgi:multidrug efflux pump
MRNDVFEKYSIPKAVCNLALPTMAGMLVVVIYNLADTFFVGQLNDANQIAAVSITMPIFLLLMAFGSIFGIGGGTYISRLLGSKEIEKAKQASAFSFYVCLGLGIICTIIGLAFMPQILNMSGASTNTYEYAKSYLTIIAMGSPVIILGFSLGQIIRSEGAAKEALLGMMLGTVINIVLDPVLILWAGMGVSGAAIATVIANVASVCYYCYYFIKKNSLLSIAVKHLSVSNEMIKAILSIGIPASLSSVLMSASNIILNNFAAGYSDNVIAALGVVGRVTMLPAMLLIGLGQGIQPLIGYNYAAQNFKRMKDVLKFTAVVGTVIGVMFTLLFFLTGGGAIKLFIDEPNVIELGTGFIKTIIISIPFLGVQFVLANSFLAMGKGKQSLVLSISRQGLLYIPILVISNYLFGLRGIVFAQPIADITTTALAVLLFARILKKLEVEENNELDNVNCVLESQ